MSGAIYILSRKKEFRGEIISREDAKAEGGYTPSQYEKLYDLLNSKWEERWAYSFVYVPRVAVPKRWWNEGNRVIYNPKVRAELVDYVDQIIRQTGWRDPFER